mgnify:CR=1 FL=1|tara:strand:+ start:19176 stop:19589 length:414 start_codon:yes stop_codon:yes gene_type:complete
MSETNQDSKHAKLNVDQNKSPKPLYDVFNPPPSSNPMTGLPIRTTEEAVHLFRAASRSYAWEYVRNGGDESVHELQGLCNRAIDALEGPTRGGRGLDMVLAKCFRELEQSKLEWKSKVEKVKKDQEAVKTAEAEEKK